MVSAKWSVCVGLLERSSNHGHVNRALNGLLILACMEDSFDLYGISLGRPFCWLRSLVFGVPALDLFFIRRKHVGNKHFDMYLSFCGNTFSTTLLVKYTI